MVDVDDWGSIACHYGFEPAVWGLLKEFRRGDSILHKGKALVMILGFNSWPDGPS